jgi:hypothetical protein
MFSGRCVFGLRENENTGIGTIPLFGNQSQQNLRWELGLANKLDILCCWVIFRFIITLLLPLIAVNREIGLVIRHTFVDRLCREKVLRQPK